jgi:hypothetical protein
MREITDDFLLQIAQVADRRVRTLAWVDMAVVALIIFDMVVKPFS